MDMNDREVASGKFIPGVSGNPNGRPAGSKGLAAYINEQTSNGHEITDFMLGVMRGEAVDKRRKPTTAERIQASTWLADRAFGKPLQESKHMTMTGSPEDWLIAQARAELYRSMPLDELRAEVQKERLALVAADADEPIIEIEARVVANDS